MAMVLATMAGLVLFGYSAIVPHPLTHFLLTLVSFSCVILLWDKTSNFEWNWFHVGALGSIAFFSISPFIHKTPYKDAKQQ